jgi:hypothetical protein
MDRGLVMRPRRERPERRGLAMTASIDERTRKVAHTPPGCAAGPRRLDTRPVKVPPRSKEHALYPDRSLLAAPPAARRPAWAIASFS